MHAVEIYNDVHKAPNKTNIDKLMDGKEDKTNLKHLNNNGERNDYDAL